MKVLLYIHAFYIGGAESLVVKYAKTLKNKGVEVEILEGSTSHTYLRQELIDSGIKILTLYPYKTKNRILVKLWHVFFAKYRYRKIIRNISPDIIHFHSWNKYIPDTSDICKSVFTFHGNVDTAFRRDAKGFNKHINYNQDVILFTELMRRDALANGISESRIHKIPNGVDIDSIKENAYTREIARSLFGINDSDFVLGHIGRYSPVKRHDFILVVFAEVLKCRPDSWLVLIGGGSEAETETLTRQAKQLGIYERVKMLGIRQDATSLLPGMDAFILPSDSESFSLAFVEAQIFNLRCIASYGVPEEVICNKNAFRLPIEDGASKWADLLLSDEEREENQDFMNFNMDVVIDRHIALYTSLLAK